MRVLTLINPRYQRVHLLQINALIVDKLLEEFQVALDHLILQGVLRLSKTVIMLLD